MLKKQYEKYGSTVGCAVLAIGLSFSAFAGKTWYIQQCKSGDTAPAGWNFIPFHGRSDNGSRVPARYANLVDSDGNATDVDLFVVYPANYHYESREEFTGPAAEFEAGRAAVTPGYQLASTADPLLAAVYNNGNSNWSAGRKFRYPCLRARLEGLDPAKLYAFTFVAQNNNDKPRTTLYTVTGATRGSAEHDAANATDSAAVVRSIAPLPDGTVEFDVRGADDSVHSYKSGFLTALKFEEMDLAEAYDQEIYVNTYGTSKTPTAVVWNKMNMNAVATSSAFKDRDGNTTTVTMTNLVAGSVNSSVTSPLIGAAAIFDEARTRSSADYNNKQIASGTTLSAIIRGLETDRLYEFTFAASRMGATKNCDSVYTVIGANTGSALLAVHNNTNAVVVVPGIQPNADGEVEIQITKGANNTMGAVYILAFRIARQVPAAGMNVVDVSATTGGSVATTVDGAAAGARSVIASSKSVVATATADAGYRFVGWTSSFTNETVTANPFTIPATASVGWTAVFEKDSAYTPRRMYVDTVGDAPVDTKSWNRFDDFGVAAYEWYKAMGPFVASDGTPVTLAIRSIRPFGRDTTGTDQHIVEHATATYVGEAADFEPARSGNKELLMTSTYDAGTANVHLEGMISYDVVGLKPGRAYTFRFIGSRTYRGASYRYELVFRCRGENTVTAYLDEHQASGATTFDRVAKLENVVPDANGTVRIEIAPTPRCNSAGRWAYLAAFSIEGDLPEPAADRGRNILWFGNRSISDYNDRNIPDLVANMAELAGHPRPQITQQLPADGSSLSDQLNRIDISPWNNIESDARYLIGGYDDVVIQGNQTEATSKGNTAPAEGFLPDATNLYALVRNGNGGVVPRAVLFETWAYKPGYASAYPGLYADAPAMQAELDAGYKAAAAMIKSKWGADAVALSPAGLVFEKAGFDDSLYDANLSVSDKGWELAAMTLYYTIYGEYIDKVVSYADAHAAGVTKLETEAEWRKLGSYVRRALIKGTMFIIR